MAEATILDQAVKQGVWAVLFISLFLYSLKESRRREDESKSREERLYNFLDDMSKQFESLAKQYEKIAEDVDEIKDDIKARREMRRG